MYFRKGRKPFTSDDGYIISCAWMLLENNPTMGGDEFTAEFLKEMERLLKYNMEPKVYRIASLPDGELAIQRMVGDKHRTLCVLKPAETFSAVYGENTIEVAGMSWQEILSTVEQLRLSADGQFITLVLPEGEDNGAVKQFLRVVDAERIAHEGTANAPFWAMAVYTVV